MPIFHDFLEVKKNAKLKGANVDTNHFQYCGSDWHVIGTSLNNLKLFVEATTHAAPKSLSPFVCDKLQLLDCAARNHENKKHKID